MVLEVRSCWGRSDTRGIRSGEEIVLENSLVAFRFDSSSGVLCSVANKELGKEFIVCKERPELFRLVYALEDYRGHHIDASMQKARRVHLEEEHDAKILTVEYDGLSSQEGEFNLRVRVTARLGNNCDEVKMQIEVLNEDRGELTQVWFPWVRGLVNLTPEGEEDILCYPAAAGSLIPKPLSYFPGRGEPLGYHEWTRELARTILARPYPGRCSMQWMDFGCPSCGLYMASYDRRGYFVVPRVQKHLWDDEEHLSLAMVRYPYSTKGESWTSPEYGVSPHKGDWHRGADKYRNWLEEWLPKRRKAEWARNVNGFYHLILRHQDGTTINKIEEIDDILAEAQAHGIDLLFVCGWYRGGHNGIYYPEFAPAQPAALRDLIARVHRSGGRVLMYLNMRSWSMTDHGYKDKGLQWTSKTRDGLPLSEIWGWALGNYPSFEVVQFGNLCPHVEEWQDMFVERVMNTVSLGADCALMDQLLVVDMCHDTTHGHRTPEASYGPGALRMAKKALSAGKANNPDFELSMEGICDIYSADIAIYHSRSDFVAYAAPEVFRYTLPWVTGITGGCVDMGDKDKVKESFMLGLILDVEIHTHNRGRLSFDPGVASEIKRVNSLRQAHKDVLVEGRFMDTEGLRIVGGRVDGRLFCKESVKLITLWNRGETPASPSVTLTDADGFAGGMSRVTLDRQGKRGEEELLSWNVESGEMTILCPVLQAGEVAVVRVERRETEAQTDEYAEQR
ncbi:MAG: DUF6259 domain-containing protein [Bacillota bacterium]